jgi:hypothetical protein
MKKKIMVFSFITAFILTACNKSGDKPALTTQEKILGKWKVNTIVEEESISGTPQTSTYNGLPDDYIDFREDGKVYYNTFGGLDTFTYRVVNDQFLIQDVVDTFEILTLTSSNFTEYHRSFGSSYKYTENLYK